MAFKWSFPSLSTWSNTLWVIFVDPDPLRYIWWPESSPAKDGMLLNVHKSSWGCHQMKTFSALLALFVGLWRRALKLCLILAWINGWVNNREADDLRPHHAHYDVTVMIASNSTSWIYIVWPPWRILCYESWETFLHLCTKAKRNL